MKAPDDLTVTTATRTEAEVRASLGQPEPAAAPVVETPAPPAGQADAVDDADIQDPVDPNASEAARTLRANRLSERKTRMQADIALYEDNVKRLGGTVKPLEPREYKKPQDELDHLARRRHELLDATNKLLRERPAPKAPAAAASQPPPPAAAQPPATRPAAPAAPAPFSFPTWEQYQEKHPDKDYTDWLDARGDAREDWKESTRRVERDRNEAERRAYADHVETQRLAREFTTAQDAFKATHPDYDEVLQRTDYPPEAHPAAVEMVNKLVTRSGKHGPAILHFLGNNAEERTALFLSKSQGDLLQTFGEIKYAALKATGLSSAAAAAASAPAAPAAAASAPAAAAPAPSRPATNAPAPLTDVRAGASDTRTLQQVAEDSDDADEYIERRRAQQKRAAGRA